MDDGLACFVMGVFLGAVGSFCITETVVSAYWHKQIQQRGYSEYCQGDGSWSWKGECNDK